MNIRDRVSLVCGADFSQRQRAIENIKKRILKDKPGTVCSFTFYCKEMNSLDLQEKLFMASFDKIKIIIFKDFNELTADVRKIMFDNLENILANTYMIFETDKDYYTLRKEKKITSDNLFNLIIQKSCLFKVVSSEKEVTMIDFMNSTRKNDLDSSLYILERMLKDGANDRLLGPQIIGVLVRKFSYLRDPVKKDKCFKYLFEADRAIKQKGLDARLVIEVLLVKLFENQ